MKTRFLIALCGALALTTASYAQNPAEPAAPAQQQLPTDTFDPAQSPGVIVPAEEQRPAAPVRTIVIQPTVEVQPAPQAAPQPQQNAGPAPEAAANCEPKCATKTIWKKKIVGYEEKVVRVPKYKKYKATVKAGCCEKPEKVKHEDVQIPPPKPKIVYQEQKIIVVTRPKVEYAPPPVVHLPPQRHIVYERQQPIYAPPAPRPIIRQQQVCCPPGQNIPGLPPCKPGQVGYRSGSAQIAQLPSRTDEGLTLHKPDSAPEGSARCTRMVNGVPMTGKCW